MFFTIQPRHARRRMFMTTIATRQRKQIFDLNMNYRYNDIARRSRAFSRMA